MAKFKSRARSLDLLGRQQIAGIPTALSEIFKNAHDAYADNMEVDYFRKLNLLLLRDDGVGMTLEDFEDRWLVIGTESKLDTELGIKKPHINQKKKIRPVMGEKGVGRLAIAAIGPQVLVVTRAKVEGKLQDYVVSLINWSLFELPNINLDEIEIPIKTYENLTDITSAEVNGLVLSLKAQTKGLRSKTDTHILDRIDEELSSFSFNERLLSLDYGPSISNGGCLFVIQPVSTSLLSDIEEKDESLASELHTMLCGFTNTMMDSEVPLKTAFRDHKENGNTTDLIGDKNFFTPEDYANSDHHLAGEVDEYGNFKGSLSVYHMDADEVELIINKTGVETECGPFKFCFGYTQGTQSESLLSSEDFHSLTSKLNKMGGVYIYRDGIRVLPYGRPDYDFLGIERRRNLKASDYYFSYRRMIGAVELTRVNNGKLVEKAGREGFMSNKAYRDFKEILESILLQLAQKYFVKEGAYAEKWDKQRENLRKQYKLLESRKKQVRHKRKRFVDSLEFFFNAVETDDASKSFKIKLESIVSEVEGQLASFTEVNADLDKIADDVIQLEASSLARIREVSESLNIKMPRSVGMNKKVEQLWTSYQITKSKVVVPAIEEAEERVAEIVGSLVESAKLHLDAKVRLEESLSSFRLFEYSRVSKEEKATLAIKKDVDEYIKELTKGNKRAKADLELHIDKTILSVNANPSQKDISSVRKELEDKLEGYSSQVTEVYGKIKHSLSGVLNIRDDKDYVDDASALQETETQLEVLIDEKNANIDTLQMGLAVKVINHEFSSNIKGVRDSIRTLKRWSDANHDLKELYNQIRDGFDHLDNYLNLFTPLEKRMRRRKTKITGQSINDFINNLYFERLERHDVSLVATDAFLKNYMESYASSIYPVFINLIDNSIYWLSTLTIKDKKIILDANLEEGGFIVADNGPGIPERDRPHIFDFGYSRKVSGGGMGLYIAKTSLNKEGFNIRLSSQAGSKGTEFIISPAGDKNE